MSVELAFSNAAAAATDDEAMLVSCLLHIRHPDKSIIPKLQEPQYALKDIQVTEAGKTYPAFFVFSNQLRAFSFLYQNIGY